MRKPWTTLVIFTAMMLAMGLAAAVLVMPSAKSAGVADSSVLKMIYKNNKTQNFFCTQGLEGFVCKEM